jgi:hypothetical protein
MGDRLFDIVINNLPMRILFEVKPELSAGILPELKPALQTLFTKNNLREAVEFVEDTPVVRVLTKVELQSKPGKSYNPRPDVYKLLDSFVRRTERGQRDTLTWWVNGVNLSKSLPQAAKLFGGRDIILRFVRAGDMEGISEEQLRAAAKSVVDAAFPPAPKPRSKPEAGEAPPPKIVKGPACDAILAGAGITSRKDFLKWALRNHPDKGGNTEAFQRVSNCVDTQYGSGRKTRRRKRSSRRRTRHQA